MYDLDNSEARREVQILHQLAYDAEEEGQFAVMERLQEQAAGIAQQMNDLPLLIKERFKLAYSQDIQGKYMQAIVTYTWLIGLATDPATSQLLSNNDTLLLLRNAYVRFVECGRYLPEMSVERLLRVVADGLDWLERIGRTSWADGLRLNKGYLLKLQGDMEGALLEMEAALALARRNDDTTYSLPSYQLSLAELLLENPFRRYAEAIALIEEVLSAPATRPFSRSWAYDVRAHAHLEMGEYEKAFHAVQEALLLAQTLEAPRRMAEVYDLLGWIYRETGCLDEAVQATTQEWCWARRDGRVEYCNKALINCARVRNLQARVACGLPTARNPFPKQIPAEAQMALALRRIQSTRRFVRWATPLAAQLDYANGYRSHQEDLDEQLQTAKELEAWLTQKRNG